MTDLLEPATETGVCGLPSCGAPLAGPSLYFCREAHQQQWQEALYNPTPAIVPLAEPVAPVGVTPAGDRVFRTKARISWLMHWTVS